MRQITVSFGKGDKAAITAVKQMPWEQFAAALTAEPPEAEDKASRGWYIPAVFDPVYRHGDNFVSRDAITFDFDHVGMESWATVKQALEGLALCMYTTHSHNETAPRFRVVVPLSRPTSFDEFQAISRKLASRFGIEMAARESFTPPQMTYLPLKSLRGLFDSYTQSGSWADVDAILGEYHAWTDKAEWPRRSSGDDIHAPSATQLPPNEKPGPVGTFCRVFSVAAAIARFDLPYKPSAASPGRWTYTLGSVAEGAIEYDDGLKFHSHHDTDPARGQNNAFDLVRLHRFGKSDEQVPATTAITDRPSYRSMVELVASLPECSDRRADEEFEDLGPPTEAELNMLTSPSRRGNDDYRPERLIYEADDGHMYRSKSEQLIASKLFAASVPFDYEVEWLGQRPDFTMYQGGRSVVWEHFGMDTPDYLAKAEAKKTLYASQDYPGRLLIWTTERDTASSKHVEQVVRSVKEYLLGRFHINIHGVSGVLC